MRGVAGDRLILSKNPPPSAKDVALDAEREVQTRDAVRTAARGSPPSPPSPVVDAPPSPVVDAPVVAAPPPVAAPSPPLPMVAPPPASRVFRSEEWNGHSKPTVYKDIRFRSLTEARFALLLDTLGIEYTFEKLIFVRPGGGTYKPDFFLPSQQLIVEIKPARPLQDEVQRCEEMSAGGHRIVLMYGSQVGTLPFAGEVRGSSRSYNHKDGLRGMAWVDGELVAGEVVIVEGRNTRDSPLERFTRSFDQPHLDAVCSTRDVRWDTPRIREAFSVVRSAK